MSGRPAVLFPLFAGIETLPGIGAKTAKALEPLGIERPRDMLFAQTVEDQQLGQPEWSAQGLPAGVYYVRIQVLSDTGLQSDFSQPRKITVGGSVQDGSGQPLHSPTGAPVQSQ